MKSTNLFGLQVLVRVVVGLTKAPKKWQYSILYVYRLAHLAKTAKIIQLLFCVQIHEHSNSPLVYSGGRVARSLVFCVVTSVHRSLFVFFFSHRHDGIQIPVFHCFNIYGFWLPLSSLISSNFSCKKSWKKWFC
jgi:hypothetical protein